MEHSVREELTNTPIGITKCEGRVGFRQSNTEHRQPFILPSYTAIGNKMPDDELFNFKENSKFHRKVLVTY